MGLHRSDPLQVRRCARAVWSWRRQGRGVEGSECGGESSAAGGAAGAPRQRARGVAGAHAAVWRGCDLTMASFFFFPRLLPPRRARRPLVGWTARAGGRGTCARWGVGRPFSFLSLLLCWGAVAALVSSRHVISGRPSAALSTHTRLVAPSPRRTVPCVAFLPSFFLCLFLSLVPVAPAARSWPGVRCARPPFAAAAPVNQSAHPRAWRPRCRNVM